jgi:hypothetical protein
MEKAKKIIIRTKKSSNFSEKPADFALPVKAGVKKRNLTSVDKSPKIRIGESPALFRVKTPPPCPKGFSFIKNKKGTEY